MHSSFEFVEGATSDLSFRARGPTLEDAFAGAAQALLAATVEQPDAVEPRERRHLTLEEPDLELLLARFLNELVYLRDA
ncbi:MAG TPA: archease, partial [Myxococcota bacterium]|nr:archease [Myxococcota bacterium]